jgi:hypothetical protein
MGDEAVTETNRSQVENVVHEERIKWAKTAWVVYRAFNAVQESLIPLYKW